MTLCFPCIRNGRLCFLRTGSCFRFFSEIPPINLKAFCRTGFWLSRIFEAGGHSEGPSIHRFPSMHRFLVILQLTGLPLEVSVMFEPTTTKPPQHETCGKLWGVSSQTFRNYGVTNETRTHKYCFYFLFSLLLLFLLYYCCYYYGQYCYYYSYITTSSSTYQHTWGTLLGD